MAIEDENIEALTAAQTPNWDILPAKGRLYIKVIEARNLWTPNAQKDGFSAGAARAKKPYCVVEFDKNEFVTREALQTNVLSPEAAALAMKEESQYRNIADDIHETQGSWMSPVWKHEASLYGLIAQVLHPLNP
ncbi:hypothetical protein BDR26DRAFT_842114, partial [Obelidium mucronatum]